MATDVGEKDAIEDTRVSFGALTFSNYKRPHVKKELLTSLLGGKVENSCHWCAELVCSGCLQDIWNIIICVVSEYINVSNPKMPTYVEKRYKYFRALMQADAGGGNATAELAVRNNPKVRELFTELRDYAAAIERYLLAWRALQADARLSPGSHVLVKGPPRSENGGVRRALGEWPKRSL